MFAPNLILEAIAVSDNMHVCAIDHDFGRARAAVVVRRHHESISTGTHHREQVALSRLGHLTLAREEIAALAYRPHDIRGHGFAGLRAIYRDDLVIRLVEHRPNQIVHRAVDNDEALHVGLLVIKDARHQHACVADHHASRLGDNLEPEPCDRFQQRVRILRGWRRLFLVRNSETAAEIKILERDSRATQPPDNRGNLLSCFGKRRHLGYLRSDMGAQSDDLELRQRARFRVVFVDLRERHAKLAVAMAGGDVRMRAWIEIRIHAQADRRAMLHAARDFCNAMQFRARLDIDHQDARFQRGLDLLVGLADAGEDNLARVRTDSKASHQLADRHDIEARAHRIEQFKDAQIRERLHRVTDQMIGAGEGLVENPEMPPESTRAINEKWSVDAARQVGERYVFGVKLIVAIFEVVHSDD